MKRRVPSWSAAFSFISVVVEKRTPGKNEFINFMLEATWGQSCNYRKTRERKTEKERRRVGSENKQEASLAVRFFSHLGLALILDRLLFMPACKKVSADCPVMPHIIAHGCALLLHFIKRFSQLFREWPLPNSKEPSSPEKISISGASASTWHRERRLKSGKQND